MKKKYHRSLFIFRRDLRLIDNTALNAALAQSEDVITCFIFDPAQVGKTNSYKSNNAIQFMLQSLQELHDALRQQHGKLYFFYGKTEDVIKKIIKNKKVDAVFCNRDYTPFSITRDNHIQKICTDHAIAFEQYGDALLNEPENVFKKDKKPYFIFTPFYKRAATIPVPSCTALHKGSWFTGNIPHSEPMTIFKKILPQHNPTIAVAGGRKEALNILHHIKELKDYAHTHDYPSKMTSHLSAHLKFGTISVREAYHAIAKELSTRHPLLRQLYWRDFFTHVAYHKPTVFGNAYHEKYNMLPWNNNKKKFLAWCNGTTGFPIVDAGMRELNATGFMHNRVRMIVASFLVKDLHINWLWGEQYFAQQLVDYDPAVNNGNWQWSASTGCDAQPYFRIFNPWLQQKKFDPECIYIKKWIAELRPYDPKIIHALFKKNSPLIKNYPQPMLDHTKESELAKRMYRKTS